MRKKKIKKRKKELNFFKMINRYWAAASVVLASIASFFYVAPVVENKLNRTLITVEGLDKDVNIKQEMKPVDQPEEVEVQTFEEEIQEKEVFEEEAQVKEEEIHKPEAAKVIEEHNEPKEKKENKQTNKENKDELVDIEVKEPPFDYVEYMCNVVKGLIHDVYEWSGYEIVQHKIGEKAAIYLYSTLITILIVDMSLTITLIFFM